MGVAEEKQDAASFQFPSSLEGLGRPSGSTGGATRFLGASGKQPGELGSPPGDLSKGLGGGLEAPGGQPGSPHGWAPQVTT